MHRSQRMAIAFAIFVVIAFLLYFISGFGIAAAVAAAVLVISMESLLAYWIIGELQASGRRRGPAMRAMAGSRLERRMGVAKNALKGRAYSQKLMLSELRGMVIDRVCATRTLSPKELSERAASEGERLFGTELLYRLYTDRILDNDGRRPRPLPAADFVEVFNNIVEDMRKKG